MGPDVRKERAWGSCLPNGRRGSCGPSEQRQSRTRSRTTNTGEAKRPLPVVLLPTAQCAVRQNKDAKISTAERGTSSSPTAAHAIIIVPDGGCHGVLSFRESLVKLTGMGAGGAISTCQGPSRDARPGSGWWGLRRRNRPRLDLGPFGDATVIRASARPCCPRSQ